MERVAEIINTVVLFLQSLGIVGGFFLVLLESIIPALPLSVFIAFNIMAFGKIVGLIISYIATITGCTLSFLLFRYVIKDKIRKLLSVKSKKKVDSLMKKISNIDFNLLVIIIAIPFTPAFLVNIAAGLSDIKIRKFIIAILIGKIAMIYFWGYIGANLIDSLKNPIILVKIIVIILIAYVISKILEKVIKVEE